MTESNQSLMSKKQLVKSTLLAALIGAIVLVTAVLPAEYGIDPIGAGKMLGFGKLYAGDNEAEAEELDGPSIKRSFKEVKLKDVGSGADVPKPAEANNAPPVQQHSHKTDTIQVNIGAGKGIEYKVSVLKHGSVKYAWKTSNDNVLFTDFHGDIAGHGAFYESYTVAYSNNMAGTFTAPFKGRHGWYFSNKKNSEDMVVTIYLDGQYELLKK